MIVGGGKDIRELERCVTGPGSWTVAFCMYPISVEEVMAIADADMLMPPKVTLEIL